ncbi:hypothetical protein AN219_36435 [Streptomyces nanshensis]|nr:hypothetical protein AN219_36435 [Streptomyces nanshensis]
MSGGTAADGRVDHVRDEAAAMVGEFRRRLVLVPLHDGGLMSAELGGLRWIYAFTSQEALAAFARGRGVGGDWEFRTLYGARLLDEVIPSLDFWCGVALDVGSEGGELLPPVRGIVPERAAVEAAMGESATGSAAVVPGEGAEA